MKFTKQEIRNLKRLCDAVSQTKKVKDKPLVEEDEFDMQLKQVINKLPGRWKYKGMYKGRYDYIGLFTKSDLQRLGANAKDIKISFLDNDESYDAWLDVADDVLDTLNRFLKPIHAVAYFDSGLADEGIDTDKGTADIGFEISRTTK